jgi:hypothetical protein
VLVRRAQSRIGQATLKTELRNREDARVDEGGHSKFLLQRGLQPREIQNAPIFLLVPELASRRMRNDELLPARGPLEAKPKWIVIELFRCLAMLEIQSTDPVPTLRPVAPRSMLWVQIAIEDRNLVELMDDLSTLRQWIRGDHLIRPATR